LEPISAAAMPTIPNGHLSSIGQHLRRRSRTASLALQQTPCAGFASRIMTACSTRSPGLSRKPSQALGRPTRHAFVMRAPRRRLIPARVAPLANCMAGLGFRRGMMPELSSKRACARTVLRGRACTSHARYPRRGVGAAGGGSIENVGATTWRWSAPHSPISPTAGEAMV